MIFIWVGVYAFKFSYFILEKKYFFNMSLYIIWLVWSTWLFNIRITDINYTYKNYVFIYFRVRKIEPKELIEVEPDIPSDSDFR